MREETAMKMSEMNVHQRNLYRMMDELTCEIIGGYENAMADYPEDSDEYWEAKEFLDMGHDALKQYFFNALTARRETQKALKFAGNDFLMERIERRLRKWGY